MRVCKLKKKYLLLLLHMFLIQAIYSQNKDDKWVFGIGINAVDYFPTNTPGNGNPDGFFNEVTNAQDHWNISGPKINATRYLMQNFLVDGSISFNSITKFGDVIVPKTAYIGIDVNLQYSVYTPFDNFNIFALAGGGYTFAFYSGGTANFGLGSNYWFSDKIGVNVQGIYKHNSKGFNLAPHFYYSLSAVFRLHGGRNGKYFKWRGRGDCIKNN